jgi:hypothetical protein
MKTDWIFKVEAKVCPNPRLTMLLEAEVVLSGDVVVMVHNVESVILVAEAKEISSGNLRTSSLCVNFVTRPTILCSSSTSILIQTTWGKIKVLMQLTHMELISKADSGATDHVTGELKLAINSYHGGDQIYTASGSGMHIKHISHSLIHTPYRDLKLNNILHVPQSSKALPPFIELHMTIIYFLNFTSNVFFIKDRESRRILLQGQSEGGCILFLVTHHQ